MKRNWITWIWIIIIFLFFFWENFSFLFEDMNLNPFDYARITNVDYKAILVDEPSSRGKIVVKERVTFDIHAASKNNLFWELWRDLPESYIDGVKVDYKVNSVKQILDDGTEITYEESSKLYWDDSDYTSKRYGPGKWYHSEGPYNESARRYECVFFYVDGLYRENVTFEIEYEMNNAALRYGDCSELYLSFYSEDSIKYLNSFKGQILIPNKDMPSKNNYEVHTYGTNSYDFPYEESDTLNPGFHTLLINLDKSNLKFKPYNEYLELSLVSYGSDSHIFTDYASYNDYYSDPVLDELRQEQVKYDSTYENYKNVKTVTLVILLVGSVLVLIYTFTKDKRLRKKHVFYKPLMQIKYFREIPSNLDPIFASKLVFCKDRKKSRKHDSDGYSSVMLSLVRKGYIELTRIDPSKGWTSNNVKIIVKYKPSSILNNMPDSNAPITPTLESLTSNEASYFNLIVRHSGGNEISMSLFQSRVSADYENTNSFVRGIDRSIVNIGTLQGYFQKADYDEPRKKTNSLSNVFLVIGILLVTLVNFISYHTHLDLAFGGFTILGITFVISALYLKKLSKNYVLLTQFGEDEYAKWKGLYDFLNSETLMSERTVVELPLWEEYLVYATAFGISEKVIAALKVRCPDYQMSPILSNPYYSSVHFHHYGHSFRSAVHTASHTSYSAGYGGHGGYGGGGRGGGGGRRRSLSLRSYM